jgi:tRNA-splicing ligase RtcB
LTASNAGLDGGYMWEGQLEKITDCKWRIPKSYKPEMRVDGVIYADEKLLESIKKDNAPEQVANVASLPGIVKSSLAMPDIHWGYGFCLTKDTKILTEFGFYKPIKYFQQDFVNQNLVTIDLSDKKPTKSSILKFIKLSPQEVFKVVTQSGYEVKTTAEHPLFTPSGMKPVEKLGVGERIAIFPFQGVPYQKPSRRIVISEKDIKKTLISLGRKPGKPNFEMAIQKLKGRNILPLTYNHPKLPYILKIMGFIFGDGTMNFIGKRGDGILHFSGKPQDLEEVRKDLEQIGYTPSPVHFSKRKSSGNKNKYYNCCSFNVNASSLVVLLETLGVPRGSKVGQAYRIPKWLFKAPLWQKRLFLASLFGCELRIPHPRIGRRGYFNAPAFPMAKREELIKNGKDFLKDISNLLKEFGVKTLYIDKRKKHVNKEGKISWALELIISPKPDNLFNLWGRIGFEYNSQRAFIANVAVQYLKLKKKILKEKERAIEIKIPQLLKQGFSYQKIAVQLAGNPLTKRFIMDVCCKLKKGKKVIPRIPFSFSSFNTYLKEATKGIEGSGVVWEQIVRIEKVSYRDFVYDFTVSHSHHNFIANNFVVSNCIGGVAATDPQKGGVISPGGVGFDINCLSGDSYILGEFGYRIKIKDYENIFNRENLVCMDFNKNKECSTGISIFLKQKSKSKVYRVKTLSGKTIISTGEHPFYTKDGMREIKKLSVGEVVGIYPFKGIDYQTPSSEVIVDKSRIIDYLLKLEKDNRGNAIVQILNLLKRKGLCSLRYNSYQLPYLLKLMGYCFGDGVVYFTNKRGKGVVCFYGEEEDLEEIKKDLEKIGFDSARIYSRVRSHKITTVYSTYKFERKEFVLKISSSALAILLVVLGVPLGNKCRKSYSLPKWLFQAPLWQKRLFLASFFGAELSSPKTMTNHGYNFYCPTLSMNKIGKYIKNGEEFLRDISSLLSEFQVEVKKISKRKEYINKDGLISYRLRLIISDTPDNLINLYGNIGFEYNRERTFLANCAIQYLKMKQLLIRDRKFVAVQAKFLHQEKKLGYSDIINKFSFPWINKRFVERSMYEGRKGLPRVGENFVTFKEFIEKATQGLGKSGMIWDKIDRIVEMKDFDNYVYDFTVYHQHHNFVANNFVVSNCGVRLLKTNLTLADVKGKISKIVNVLYQDVPSGVGSKGEIKVSHQEEKKILLEGAQWAVSRGLGVREDIDACEDLGAIEGADPDSVSERAYERGKRQAGTLGSGNHFLELQVIEEIFDKEVAEKLGLFIGQIAVMVHSGSRGFGYQVCDDYIRVMVRSLPKYGITLPDRQLACAPLDSEEAKNYVGAMRAAANYAWANRQVLMHLVRKSFEKVFSKSWQSLGMSLVYDVAHNIAKFEKHVVDGKEKLLCVHRKGATRAFGPQNPQLPLRYRGIGQPVIIPGDMGTASYLLVGTKKAEEESFASTCHGAGRVKSRHEAVRTVNFDKLIDSLRSKGIEVRATGKRTIVEEAPDVYKNVNDVVEVVCKAGLSRKVCRLRPLCVVKG